jgi:hypothetical protein
MIVTFLAALMICQRLCCSVKITFEMSVYSKQHTFPIVLLVDPLLLLLLLCWPSCPYSAPQRLSSVLRLPYN